MKRLDRRFATEQSDLRPGTLQAWIVASSNWSAERVDQAERCLREAMLGLMGKDPRSMH